MIEEITDIDNRGLIFSRCIHLDTDSKFGTDFENSILNLLDVAINIYEGDTAKKDYTTILPLEQLLLTRLTGHTYCG